ncbi:hypothetical protein BSKO_03146 [Bryopsis sp. KO-2023]|nr:hypothetical protein BSKO_03146 [Bryopsis sp. KO-2023]
MVRVESTFLLKLGAKAPDFTLIEPKTGRRVSLKDATFENGVLVAFICNHCPFVKWIAKELRSLGEDLEKLNVGMVGISSTDYEDYPEDSPEEIKRAAGSVYSTFPYLLDDAQDVAKAYGANCTPDFFLLNKDGEVFYKGQLDDSRPGSNIQVNGADIRNAVARMIAGEDPPANQKRAMGCSIKWKAGNAPDYA